VLCEDEQGLLLDCQLHQESGVVGKGPHIPLVPRVEEDGSLIPFPEFVCGEQAAGVRRGAGSRREARSRHSRAQAEAWGSPDIRNRWLKVLLPKLSKLKWSTNCSKYFS
jgi:hypothetical protein